MNTRRCFLKSGKESKMDFSEYQLKAMTFAVYPKERALEYSTLGLTSEAGEVAGKVKKYIRGDVHSLTQHEVASELGDVLWYCAAVADASGIDLQIVANNNIEKLTKRKSAGTIKGSGDDR